MLLIVLAAASGPLARPLTAQAPVGWLTVSEPFEWSSNRVLAVTPGTRITVVGRAFHSRGIESITLDGNPARMRVAAENIVDFEVSMTAPNGSVTVTLVARPTSGAAIQRTFTLRAIPQPLPPIAPPQRYSPAGAAVRSVLIPGLGQVYTERPLLGVLFLGASAGAAAFGVLYTEQTVRCLSPLVDGVCPSGQEHSRFERTPFLMEGIGAAIGIAVLAAVEAQLAVRRLNARNEVGAGLRPSLLASARPTIGISEDGVHLGLRMRR